MYTFPTASEDAGELIDVALRGRGTSADSSHGRRVRVQGATVPPHFLFFSGQLSLEEFTNLPLTRSANILYGENKDSAGSP